MSIGSSPIGAGPIGASVGAGVNPFDIVLVEALAFSSSSMLGRLYTDATSDTVRFELLDKAITAWAKTLSNTIALTPTMSVALGAIMRERLRVANTLLANQKANLTLADALAASSTLMAGLPAALSDTVGVSAVQVAQQAASIIEELGIAPALSGAGVYHLTLAQALQLTDALLRFLTEDMIDGIALAEVLGVRLDAYATASDQLDLTDDIAPLFLLSATAADTIDIEAVSVEQMLFSPTLQDGIEISAGYLEPNGSFTTWVMNARNGAVTEYQNYAFNSFAKLGDTYIGAADTGVYELVGDTDDGDDIVARIKSGFMQFGGTHLSRLSAAYIAATGEGVMVLKIITKEGQQYTYQADTRNGRSTKVHMGKGQRSRYFAFELTSAGQDFDLDTLEFVPVVVGRRV